MAREKLTNATKNSIPYAVLIQVNGGAAMGYLIRKTRGGKKYGSYIACWKTDDGWVRRSTRTRNRKLALKKLAQYEMSTEFPGAAIAVPQFRDFAAEYLNWCAANKKYSTWDGERRLMPRMVERWGHERLDYVDAASISKYVEHRRRQGVRASSINREMSMLRSMFELAVLRHRAAVVPQIPRLRESDSERRATLPSGFCMADVLKHINPRARLAALTMYHTGMRRGSVCSLTWDMIDLEAGLMQLPPAHLKQGRAHDVWMSDELIKEFSRVPVQKRTGKIFTGHASTLTRYLRSAMIAAGFYRPGSVCHALRHQFATDMLRRGVDPRTVQELCGWATMSMVELYAHTSAERQRAAVRGRTAGRGKVVRPNFGGRSGDE